MKLYSNNGKRDNSDGIVPEPDAHTAVPPAGNSDLAHVRPISLDPEIIAQMKPPVQQAPAVQPPQQQVPRPVPPPAQQVQPPPPQPPAAQPAAPAPIPDLLEYPDEYELTEEQERAIQMAKSRKLVDPDELAVLRPEPGFSHLAPPKKSVGKILLIILFILFITGIAGAGVFYYWWTHYATFEYQLQPIVILDGQSVQPNDFLPGSELSRGLTARFKDSAFTPVPGPMTVPLILELGLRSLETDATLYVLTPEIARTHEYMEEAPDLTPQEFITNAGIARNVPFEVVFIEPPLSPKDYAVGEHILHLALNGVPFDVLYTVEDTTPPTATPEAVIIEIGELLSPEAFLTDVFDRSGVASVAFSGEHDGESFIAAYQDNQIVEIEVTDIYGNAQKFASSMVVLRNQSPPSLTGVPPVIESMAGKPVEYPDDITAVDDFGRDVGYIIDDAHIDINETGMYNVNVIAEDFSGYTTISEVELYIIAIDPEEVNMWVDNKLSEILKDEMTQEQKVRAIWSAVRAKISFGTNLPDEWTGSLYAAAHWAINNSRGDYYHYYALSEIMLTRADITNMRIERSVEAKIDKPHFWNLVYYDDGWYHYDSTFVSNWTSIITVQHKFTQEQAAQMEKLMIDSRSFGGEGYYDFDEDKYPDVVQE